MATTTTTAKIVLEGEDKTSPAIASAQRTMAGLQASAINVQGTLLALGATGAALSFAGGIKSAIDQADALNKLSQRTGIATEQLSQWQFAAKLSDVSADSLTTGIKKLNISIAEGAAGDKEKIAVFKAMGISLKDAAGNVKTADQVLLEMADTFSTAKDGAGKTALAVGVLGKAGDEMIPLLNGGSGAIKDMMKNADRLGLTISSDFAKKAEEFNDNLTILEASGKKLGITLGAELVDGLGKATKAMVDALIPGGKLQGLIAFIQTFLTGDDRHKNNKALVEWTDEIVNAQNAIDKLKSRIADRGPNATAAEKSELARQEARLKNAQEEIKIYQTYRKLLDDEEKKTKTDSPKKDKSIGIPTKKEESKESEYDKLIKKINEKIATDDEELRMGRKLTEFEKFRIKTFEEMNDARKKLTDSEKSGVLIKMWEAEASDNAAQKQKSEFDQAMEIAKARQKQRDDEYKAGQELVRQAIEDNNARNKTAREMLENIQFETSLLGMNTQERDRATAARELERAGLREGSEAWDIYADAIKKAMAERTAAQQGIERLTKDWNAVDSAGREFVQGLEGGFGNAIDRMRAKAKTGFFDYLYEQAARPILLEFTAQVTGASPMSLANVTNQTFGAGASSGFLGSALSSAFGVNGLAPAGGLIDSALGIFGGGSGIGGAAITSAEITGTMASTIEGLSGLGASASEITAIAEGLGSTMTATGGALGGISGALAAVPGWGWAALAATAVLGLGQGGEKRTGGQYNMSGLVSAPTGGDIGGWASSKANMDLINATLAELGTGLKLIEYFTGAEASSKGKGFAYAGGILSNNTIIGQGQDGFGYMNRRGSKSTDQAMAELAEEQKQLYLQALRAADLKGALGQYLRDLGDIDQLSGSALDTAVATISKRMAMEAQLLELQSTEAENLARARKKELDAMDAMLRPLAEQIYAQQDLKKAMQETAGSIASLRAEAVNYTKTQEDAALSALASEIERQSGWARAAQQAAEERVNSISAVFDSLKSAVQDFYGSIASTAQQAATDGSKYIAVALAQARNTGYLPENEALQKAIADTRSYYGMDTGQSAKERQYAQLVVAGQLSQLKDISGIQLTEAQKAFAMAESQLETLQKTYDTAREQLEATREVTRAVQALKEGPDQTGRYQIAGFDKNMSMIDSLLAALSTSLQTGAATRAAAGAGTLSTADISEFVKPRLGISEALNAEIYNAASKNKDRGVTLARIDEAAGLQPGTAAAWAIANNKPLFATGAAFRNGIVTRPTAFDIGVMGEQDPEGILPLTNVGGRLGVDARTNNAELVKAIADNGRAIQALESQLKAIKVATEQTAKAVNGRPDVPMLVEVVV